MCPIILSGKCRQLPSDLHQIVMMKALESSLVMLVTKKVIVFFLLLQPVKLLISNLSGPEAVSDHLFVIDQKL